VTVAVAATATATAAATATATATTTNYTMPLGSFLLVLLWGALRKKTNRLPSFIQSRQDGDKRFLRMGVRYIAHLYFA
jgi:hypothetical protein